MHTALSASKVPMVEGRGLGDSLQLDSCFSVRSVPGKEWAPTVWDSQPPATWSLLSYGTIGTFLYMFYLPHFIIIWYNKYI